MWSRASPRERRGHLGEGRIVGPRAGGSLEPRWRPPGARPGQDLSCPVAPPGREGVGRGAPLFNPPRRMGANAGGGERGSSPFPADGNRGWVPPVYFCGLGSGRAGRGPLPRGAGGGGGDRAALGVPSFWKRLCGPGREGGREGGAGAGEGEGFPTRRSPLDQGTGHPGRGLRAPRPAPPPARRPGSLPLPLPRRLPLASPLLRPSRRWRTCRPPRSRASRQENPASFLVSPAFPLTQSRHQLIRGTEGKKEAN